MENNSMQLDKAALIWASGKVAIKSNYSFDCDLHFWPSIPPSLANQ